MTAKGTQTVCLDRCSTAFEEIHEKLDRLDEAIRGNGRPGIALRLDRLEQDARRQSRLLWMVLGSGITAATSALSNWLQG